MRKSRKKSGKPVHSKRMRRALEEQVREYVRRYHPEMGEVDVEIDGHFASVRKKTEEGGA